MPEPLKSKDKSGAPFTRPPEIEACLGMLESVDAAARLKAFAVAEPGHGIAPAPDRPQQTFGGQGWQNAADRGAGQAQAISQSRFGQALSGLEFAQEDHLSDSTGQG